MTEKRLRWSKAIKRAQEQTTLNAWMRTSCSLVLSWEQRCQRTASPRVWKQQLVPRPCCTRPPYYRHWHLAYTARVPPDGHTHSAPWSPSCTQSADIQTRHGTAPGMGAHSRHVATDMAESMADSRPTIQDHGKFHWAGHQQHQDRLVHRY